MPTWSGPSGRLLRRTISSILVPKVCSDAPQRVPWLYHVNEGLPLTFQGSERLGPYDAVRSQAVGELKRGHDPAGVGTEVTVSFKRVP